MKATLIIAKTIAALTALLLTQTLKAQVTYGVNVHGIVNTAEFNSETGNNETKDLKLGYGGGLFVNFPVGESLFNINASVNYQQKGVKVKEDLAVEEPGTTLKTDSHLTLNYIEVPVMVIYNFNKEANTWFAGVGPSFGYGIGGKAEVFLDGEENGQSFSYYYEMKPFKDIEEEDGMGFKRFDVSGKILIGKRVLDKGTIQLAYQHGFNNIANRDEYKGNKYQSRSLMLTLSYAIN